MQPSLKAPVIVILVAVLAFSASASMLCTAYAGDSRTVIGSQYTGEPPSIDGVAQAGEWSNLEISFTSPEYPDYYVLPTHVYFMNDAMNLYVLVDAIGDTTNEAGDECLLIFDFNSDPEDGYVVARILQTGVGPLTWVKSSGDFDAAIGYSGSPLHKVYEFSIPFSFLGGSSGDSFDFCSPFFKTGPALASMPFDSLTLHDNVWPQQLGTGDSWKESIDGWGILNTEQAPQRIVSRPNPVGGFTKPVSKLALLAPYLVFVGLVAFTSTAYFFRKGRVRTA